MIYLELLWSFFQIGLLSIGGGYASLSLIQEQVIDIHQWLNLSEFSDIITISQMTPGPIAINAATFVGQRIAGIPGALVATLGCVLPSYLILYTLSYFYFRYRQLAWIQGILAGLKPAVVALIAAAGIRLLPAAIGWTGEAVRQMSLASVDWLSVGILALGLFVLRKWKPDPVLAILGSGVLYVLAQNFL